MSLIKYLKRSMIGIKLKELLKRKYETVMEYKIIRVFGCF